jgi:hypothetical protein
VLGTLDLPRPFSVEALCEHMGERRQRPVYLHPLPMQEVMEGAYGLWVGTGTDDHIFFEQRTSRLHREHIVLHEIGHMLFDHHPLDRDDGWTATLFPDLDPGMIHRLLARTNYSTRQEQEAEMIASLMRTSVRSGAAGRRNDVMARLEAGLGLGSAHDD